MTGAALPFLHTQEPRGTQGGAPNAGLLPSQEYGRG
jgi:hypothetical protein